MSAPPFAKRVTALISRFRRDKKANIAVIFAIALIPILTALGCAVDYSLATRLKAKLQSAADGASVAAIAKNSLGYIQASTMTSDGTVSAGQTDALNVFNGNMSTTTGYTFSTPPTATVTKTGLKLTSVVQFSAVMPTTFLKAVGFPSITVSGSSSSTASFPPYLDFYLALDVSGSMGLPSTPAEAQRMQYYNPDNYVDYPTGCTLACHFSQPKSACLDPTNPPKKLANQGGYPTNGYCLGYAISRVSPSGFQNLLTLQSPQGTYPYKNSDPKSSFYQKYQQLPDSIVNPPKGQPGLPTSLYNALPPVSSCPTDGTDNCIQLRLDAVGNALNDPNNGLFAVAQKKHVVTNQFRIGLYPFITDIDKNYSPLTTAINASDTTPGTINYAAKDLASELDTSTNANLGSGGTHIDNALHSINALITSVGGGSSATNTLPYVFLVTDGAQDNQYRDANGNWHPSNHATVVNDKLNNTYPTICADLKARGIMVSVLYIPYQTISPVNKNFAGDEDDYANWNIPNIPASLQDCASPPDAGGSYYYVASSPQQIKDSLNAMFNHSLQTAHITN